MTAFKPLLASKIPSIKKLDYPLIASPKIDGIRCLIHPGLGPVTRSLKPIRNDYIRSCLANNHIFDGLDGELIVGDPTDPLVFRNTSSAVMSKDGTPDFTFHVFDYFITPEFTYATRWLNQNKKITKLGEEYPFIKLVPQSIIVDEAGLNSYSEFHLSRGYEGIMLRKATGYYKYGRSTFKEHILLKHKPFADSEALLIGMEERMHNANELTKDELGYAKRSTHKANKQGRGDMGALIVSWPMKGEEKQTFNIGTGFTDEDREWFWDNQDDLIGRLIIKFKYQDIGNYVKPRCPVFVGVRELEDLS